MGFATGGSIDRAEKKKFASDGYGYTDIMALHLLCLPTPSPMSIAAPEERAHVYSASHISIIVDTSL